MNLNRLVESQSDVSIPAVFFFGPRDACALVNDSRENHFLATIAN